MRMVQVMLLASNLQRSVDLRWTDANCESHLSWQRSEVRGCMLQVMLQVSSLQRWEVFFVHSLRIVVSLLAL